MKRVETINYMKLSEDIYIISEGFQGDRHIMSFEEAKNEIYDITLMGDVDGFDDYLEENPNNTIADFGNFKTECFEKDMLNGYCFEYKGVKYSVLNDEKVEKIWNEFEDILFDESEKRLVLSDDWFIFDKGTERGDIWRWFDEHHSKGIGWLINEYER